MPRILILSSQPPFPPHGGGALRIGGLLHGLHEAGYSVDLLTFGDPRTAETLAASPAKLWCQQIQVIPPPPRSRLDRIRDLLLSAAPDLIRRFWSDDYQAALRQWLDAAVVPDPPHTMPYDKLHGMSYDIVSDISSDIPYDVIQLESLEMAAYLDQLVPYRQQHGAKLIYDSFNAEFALQRGVFATDRRSVRKLPRTLYSWMQWRRLTRFERNVCKMVNHVFAVSDDDAHEFRTLLSDRLPVPDHSANKLTVIPNGIDTADYAPDPDNLLTRTTTSPNCLFTGTLDYRPNVDAILWFTTHIWPRVRQHLPTVALTLVGRSPAAEVRALHGMDGITVAADAPDIMPYLHAATVYVAPLRMGSGTRLKLLQALSARLAIVATSLGAAGLHGQSGTHYIIADDAVTFADAIITLLHDADRRAALGAAGSLLANAYDWRAIWPRLWAAYDRLLASV